MSLALALTPLFIIFQFNEGCHILTVRRNVATVLPFGASRLWFLAPGALVTGAFLMLLRTVLLVVCGDLISTMDAAVVAPFVMLCVLALVNASAGLSVLFASTRFSASPADWPVTTVAAGIALIDRPCSDGCLGVNAIIMRCDCTAVEMAKRKRKAAATVNPTMGTNVSHGKGFPSFLPWSDLRLLGGINSESLATLQTQQCALRVVELEVSVVESVRSLPSAERAKAKD